MNYVSITTYIPAMQTRGVKVGFSSRTPTTFVKVSVTAQQAGVNTTLPFLFVIEVRDQNNRPFAGVPVTFSGTAGGGGITTTTTTTDHNGRAEAHLTLKGTPGIPPIRVTAPGLSQSVQFTTADTIPITIPDAALRARIAETLGKPRDEQITLGNMLALTKLEVGSSNIQDLTGLEHAHNLDTLRVSWNDISDVSPLAHLTKLTELSLHGNAISDVSPLANLTKLTKLMLGDYNIWGEPDPAGNPISLYGNTISDVSPLANLTQLETLSLDGNPISDVSPLAHLTKLTTLLLRYNAISDVSPLAHLTKLTTLALGGNAISDVAPLAHLTQLETLYLYNNAISDVTPLTNLTKLTDLKLSGNAISDVAPLAHLTQLETLYLYNNAISDVTPLAHLTQLTNLYLFGNDISDMGPLVGLNLTGGYWHPTGLDLRSNPLNSASINTHIPAMQAKGILVKFDDEVPAQLAADVNADGTVNIQDLVLVASHLGKTGQNVADVNADGTVNIQDLVLVAGDLGTDAAAPSAWDHTSIGVPAHATVEQWLTQAYSFSLTDARSQRGIIFLERLLAALVPKEIALLPNYPNPFNPETWIPYHLSEPAGVTLTIYSIDGKVVRRLDLGHQAAGFYQSKARAAYWDGRNNVGERVASGIYFYTLDAGDFAATKKMLILK